MKRRGLLHRQQILWKEHAGILLLPTWIRFAIWMALGVGVYLLYGRRHSVLGRRELLDGKV